MKKIILEFEKIRDPFSGLGQYCLHLGKELSSKEDVFFYLNQKFPHPFSQEKVVALKSLHKTFKFLAPKADLWHAIHQDSKFLPRNSSAKYILTIHDLNHIAEHSNPFEVKSYLSTLQKRIDHSQGLTFISKYTKNFVAQHLKIDHVPSEVIYNGICLDEAILPQKPAGITEGAFLFSVGTVLPKKNFHVLVEMLKLLPDLNIFLAGSLFSSYAKEIKELITKFQLENRFILLGTISDAEKIWLHKNCTGFVFPSLLEGFGLPVAEAMANGKPIFLSRLTSLPEVGGEGAYYFDNFKADHMAQVVSEGLKNFNEERKLKLLKRSELFNWKKAANDYYSFYQKVLNS